MFFRRGDSPSGEDFLASDARQGINWKNCEVVRGHWRPE